MRYDFQARILECSQFLRHLCLQTNELGLNIQCVLQLFLVAQDVRFPSFDPCLEFQQGAPSRRNGLCEASSAFLLLSSGRTISAVFSVPPTGSSTSWRQCHAVGKSSRSMISCVISVTCSAGHSNIISDSCKETLRLFRPLLKLFHFAREFLRTTETFHVNETRSVFPNLSCRGIVDGTYCFCRSILIFQRDDFLLELCDNLFNRNRHSRIDNKSTHKQNPRQMRHQCFSCLLLRQGLRISSCAFARRTPRELDKQTCPLESSQAHHQATKDDQRYATMMFFHDYLSWIVFWSHSGGVRVSEGGEEQILHLIRTVGLKATVSVCTP